MTQFSQSSGGGGGGNGSRSEFNSTNYIIGGG